MAYRLVDSHNRPHAPRSSGPGNDSSRRRRAARRTLSVLPSLFTIGNLLCGFAAVFYASRTALEPAPKLPWGWSPLNFAAVLIFIGMVFDGLDGRIARLTRHTSDLGEQLDSMADMVTFGVAPAFLAIQLVGLPLPFIAEINDLYVHRLVLIVALIYVACTALRLARFNIEARSPHVADHMNFKGLPSPGAAGTVASMIMLHQHLLREFNLKFALNDSLAPPMSMSLSAIAMVAIMLLAALAMISNLPYAHVTNRFIRGRAPVNYIAKIVIVLLLVAVFPIQTLAAAFLVYALSGPAVWLWRAATGKPATIAVPPASTTTAAPPQPEHPEHREVG